MPRSSIIPARALLWLPAAALLTAAGCGGSGIGGTPAGASLDSIGTTLDSYVPSRVQGYSFVLVSGTAVLYQRADGTMTLTQSRPLDVASQAPAAAAVLTLVDQGLLDLDRPVGDYLNGHISWPSDKGAITTRMLLSHTSGLPGLDHQSDSTYPTCVNDPSSGITLQQCAQQIANTPLAASPGTQFDFGIADDQVAGYLATVIAQQSWNTLFQNRIAAPLGINFGFDPGSVNPRIGSGGFAGAPDYARFLQMLLNDGQFGSTILGAASVTAMQTDQVGGCGCKVAYEPFPPNLWSSYPGYGFGVFIDSPDLYPGSPGPEFSDPGASGATPWFDRGLGYAAVLLIDPIPGNSQAPDAVARDIWKAVRPQIIRALTS